MKKSLIDLALTRTIKGKKHYAYESKEEFRKAHPDTPLITDWKQAKEGDWCLSDDGKIVQILKKGCFVDKKKRDNNYIRTVIGMFNHRGSSPFAGTIKDEIYRFTKKTSYMVNTTGDRWFIPGVTGASISNQAQCDKLVGDTADGTPAASETVA